MTNRSASATARTALRLITGGISRPMIAAAVTVVLLAGPGSLAPTAALAATFLERAEQHFEEGDFRAAEVELKNALQRNPDDAEARFLLGKVHMRLGDPVTAEKELLRAKELGMQSEALDLMLAYTRLEQRRFESVVSDLGTEFTIDSPVERDLIVARGEALLGLGRIDEARSIFDRVLEVEPHARALVNSARISMIIGEPDRARSLLDQARAIDPDDPLLATVDAAWHFNAKDYTAAKDLFAQAAKLNPNQLLPYVGQVQSLLALKELEQAGNLVEKLKATNSENVIVVLLDSIIQFLSNNHQQAKSAADRVLAANNKQPQALLISGYSAYQLGQYEQARAKLLTYLSRYPEDDRVRAVLGASLMRLGYSEDAYKTLGTSKGEIPESADYLSLLTGAAFASGDQEAGRRYLEQLATRKPNDPALQLQLGMARLEGGDRAGALAALETSLSLDPTRRSTYDALFSLHLAQNEYDKANEIGRKLQEQYPKEGSGYTLVGLAELAASDRSGARTAFEKAVDLEPGNVAAATNLANLHRLDQELNSARSVLDSALSTNPGNLRLLLTYAAMEDGAGDRAKAQRLLRDAISGNPEALQPKLILARQYLSENRAGDALALAEPALQANPTNSELLSIVGQARLRTGETAKGLEAIRRLVSQSPSDINAQMLLMAALEQSGRSGDALAVADRVLSLDEDNAPVRLARARYLTQLGRYQEAKSDLKRLRELTPENVEPLILEARIAVAENETARAIEWFQRAYEMQPSSIRLSDLVRAKYVAGEKDEAVSLMKNWTESHPGDLLIRNSLAEALIGQGQFSEALEHYRAILSQAPENSLVWNNMAWLQTIMGDAHEAVTSARRAVELEPENPSFGDTLAVALLDSSRPGEALEILQALNAEEPDNPSVKFHFARALAETGNKQEAIGILDALLSSDAQFSERGSAEKLLRSLN